mmetsp:Transcript_21056/g.65007  ORF Transcript_21056/g.65007 Transcript_21056/m.65007 type:complete len:213 (+) Transcript_21056:211-849(+)
MTGGGGGSNNEGAYIKRTRKETWEGRLRSVGRRLEAVDAFFDVGDGLVDALDVEDVPALGFEEVADRQGDAREGGGGGAGGDGVGAVGVERGDDFVGQAAPRIARRVGQFAHDELARFAGAPRFPEPLQPRRRRSQRLPRPREPALFLRGFRLRLTEDDGVLRSARLRSQVHLRHLFETDGHRRPRRPRRLPRLVGSRGHHGRRRRARRRRW